MAWQLVQLLWRLRPEIMVRVHYDVPVSLRPVRWLHALALFGPLNGGFSVSLTSAWNVNLSAHFFAKCSSLM